MPKLKAPKPAAPRDSRDERLAVNISDLERLDGATLARMTMNNGASRIDWNAKVDLRDGDARSEEVAVEFCCPLFEAALILDAMRELDRRADERPTRVYVKRRSWSKVSGPTPLTVPDGAGGFMLNPEVFPPVVTDRQLGALALVPQRVKLGRT